MPAQLTGMNGALARPLITAIARATISLPTPLSPVTNTFASERPTRSTSALSSMMAALVPMNSTLPVCLIAASHTVDAPVNPGRAATASEPALLGNLGRARSVQAGHQRAHAGQNVLKWGGYISLQRSI